MPVINLSTLKDILGGTSPVSATISAYVYRGTQRAVRYVGEDVIFPAPVTVDILSGVLQHDLDLATIPADCYWKIIVWSDSKTPLRRDVILPAGPGPFDFDELIDIIPETNLPVAGSDLANAYLNSLTDLTVRIEAAADSIPSNIDGGTATSIYTTSQTLDGGTAGNI